MGPEALPHGSRPMSPRPAPAGATIALPDFGSPFGSKSDVVAYDRHVVFAPDDPADAARHRAPGLISATRIDKAFVHELPEQLVGRIFAQADAFAYACDLGVGVYLVPSALALVARG